MIPVPHDQARAQFSLPIVHALRRTERHRINVKLYQLSQQWICAVGRADTVTVTVYRIA